MTVDLDAYFARIGYTGPREPTLATLEGLHARHPRAIPFENLTPLLGETPKLDLQSLQAKLVAGRRGGYCFEHNGLFKAALEALGFEVEPLAARVQWNVPPERHGPRTHMALRVHLPEGRFHVDVGFGGMTQTGPLRLVPDIEQTVGGATYRLVSAPHNELQLQALLPGRWVDMYRLGPARQAPLDYEVANWFTSTHPNSPFLAGLMATFVGEDRRYALANNQLSVYGFDGSIEKRTLDAAELEAVMHETFGLARPDGLGGLYQRLAQAPK